MEQESHWIKESPRSLKLSAAISRTIRSQELDALAQLTGFTQFKLGPSRGMLFLEEIPNKTCCS